MDARGRRRIVVGALALLLAGALVYAFVLHPGANLMPQVEAYLRDCDADRVAEAAARTALFERWDLGDQIEAARFRRGVLGRFEGVVEADRPEPVSGSGAPQRRVRARLRFAKRPEPVAASFLFVRGQEGWLLADVDIPTPGAPAGLSDPAHVAKEAESLILAMASQKYSEVYARLSRATRITLTSDAFEERMLPQVDGLGAPRTAQVLENEAQGAGRRVRVEVRYDSGTTRVMVAHLVLEDGRWRASGIEVEAP